MNVYEARKRKRFLSHRFDSYAGMSFPDADADHLETCIAIFLWAFSVRPLPESLLVYRITHTANSLMISLMRGRYNPSRMRYKSG